ncbi:unnamed protein product [Adineta ricciae]|uniref:Uncharacterized protein n=1 Tax=Adineta ricciae TaxID=249248 RepID=A0A815YUS5_ADIRI|nr:unnamed protein product [Adineta ricciae]
MDINNTIDFPELDLDFLREYTCETYQMKQSKAYAKAHFYEHDNKFELQISPDDDQLIWCRLHSHHSNTTYYFRWMQTSTKLKTWSSFTDTVSITQYYEKFIELCKKVDVAMPDSLKLKYLMAGIKESLGTRVALQDPKSTEAFLSLARKIEDIFALKQTDLETSANNTCLNVTAYHSQPNQTNFTPASNNNFRQSNPRYSTASKNRLMYNRNTSNGYNGNRQSKSSKYTKSTQRSNACFNCAPVDGVASRMLHSNPSTLNTSLLYLDVLVNNKRMKAMIDTGANRTFISLQALPRPHTQQFTDKQQRSASLADGHTSLSILGTLELCIDIGDMSTIIKGYVVKELCAECILGMDFISKYKLIINADERTVTMHDDDRCITTTFNVNQRKIRYPARTIRQVYIPPKRAVSIPVDVKISSAKVSFRPSFRLARQSPMILLNNMVVVNHQKSHISLYNPTKYSYTIPEGIVVGTTTVPTLSFNKCLSIDHELVNGYITKLTRHVADPKQADEIKNILHHHEKLFDTSKPANAVNVKPHEIKTLDYPPPTSRPYYSTPRKEEEMYNIVQDLLEHGLIRKSYSPFAAPALLVPKHDRTWRMVVDYKKLNNITIKDNHSLPNMEQKIRRLGRSQLNDYTNGTC